MSFNHEILSNLCVFISNLRIPNKKKSGIYDKNGWKKILPAICFECERKVTKDPIVFYQRYSTQACPGHVLN